METQKRKSSKQIPDAIKRIHFKIEVPENEKQSKKYRVPLELSRFSHIMPVKVDHEDYEIKFQRKYRRSKKKKIVQGERICMKDYRILSITRKKESDETAEFEFKFIN